MFCSCTSLSSLSCADGFLSNLATLCDGKKKGETMNLRHEVKSKIMQSKNQLSRVKFNGHVKCVIVLYKAFKPRL